MADAGVPHLRYDRGVLRLTVAVCALALAGVNYQSNAAWLLASAVTALAAISALHARRNLHGLTLRACPTVPVYAGDAPQMIVILRAGAHGAAGVVVHAGDGESDPLSLPPDGEGAAVVRLPPRARGVHRLSAPKVRSTWPLGLIASEITSAGDIELVVWPAPVGRPFTVRGRPEHGAGSVAGEEHGDDFAGHRAWRPGEGQRRIDWKAVARGRPMLLKRFDGRVATCWLEWSDAAAVDDEVRLGQLARWIIEANDAGLRYGLRVPGREVMPDAGELHRLACLRILAEYPSHA